MLFFEKKWVSEDDITPPQITDQSAWVATFLLFFTFCTLLFFMYQPHIPKAHFAITALISARLFALDAQHRILPNIYVVPLLFLGLWFGYDIDALKDALIGLSLAIGIVLVITLFAITSHKNFGIGGGDLKMMLVLGAFSGTWLFFPTLSAVSILALIGSFFLHRKEEVGIPLGCYLILGLWGMLIYRVFLLHS